jgi:integrase
MAKGIYERTGKNGDVTYYIRYQFKAVGEGGTFSVKDLKEKVGRKSRGFTREMAKEALKAREGEIAQGRFNLEKSRKPHPFSELVERYHKHAESYKASYSRERYSIERIKEYFAGRYLSDVTTWAVEKWKRERAKQVQPSTVNRELTILKHMLKMAVRWELASTNPAASVAPFPGQEGRTRFASEEELPRLLEACRNQITSPWLYPSVILAINTGPRQGNLLNLKFEDIDLEQNLIHFVRTKNRKVNVVPMNREAREAVEWFLQHRYGDYLIMWPWAKRLGRTTLYDAFKRACKEAGIENFRWHDLRHTTGSYLVMAGNDLVTVQQILGHRDIKSTLRYAHLAPAHKARAVEKLGETFGALQERKPAAPEAGKPTTPAANLAQFRNVLLVVEVGASLPLSRTPSKNRRLTQRAKALIGGGGGN